MGKVIGFAGAAVAGTAGWWLGHHVGLMTAFMVSTVGSGVGLYAGRRFARDHFGD